MPSSFVVLIFIESASSFVPLTLHHYALKIGKLSTDIFKDNRLNIIILLATETYLVLL